MIRVKTSLDHKRIRFLIWLVLILFVLLGYSLQSAAGSAYYSMLMQNYGTVSSPPVILQNGTAGESTIYMNRTSAKVSVEAPSVYDFVDNNISNVDSNATIGTHSNFTAEKYGPDSVFDNLTETDNGGAVNDSENFVDDNTSNIDGVDDKGTHSNFTAQQYGPDSINDTLTEGNTEPNSEYVWISGNDDFVRKLNRSDLGGTEILSWDTGEKYPYGCEFRIENGNEYIYVVDPGSQADALIKFHASNGTEVIRWDISGYSGDAWGLAWNGSRWFICDKNDDLIYQVDPADPTVAERSFSYTGIGIAAGLAWDGSYLWVVDFESDYAYQIDVYGNIQTSWSTATNLTQPTGIAYDTTSGHLCIVGRGSGGYLYEYYTNGTAISGWDRSGTDPEGVAYASVEDTYNYELDLEIRWTTADYDETNEYLCINVGTTGDEDLKVEVWTGSWTNLLIDLNASTWNNVSVSSYLTSDTLIVRFLGGTESGDSNQDSWQIECSLLHVWSWEYNYTLDLEIQWTDTNYTRTKEELCIKTGTTDTEDIEVYAWNITGSSWHKVFDDLAANTWNNISVSNYLTDSNFTIRFRGGNETGDATQSSWNIDASLLHVWNDIEDYVDNNTSNVDNSDPEDKGTHSNFTAQQYGPDSIYDTLTEENITVGGSGIGIDAQTGATDTDATVSWNHTVGTGSNRLLVVGVAFEHDTTPYPSVSNVQYNSVSLTKIADRDGVAPGSSYTAHASLWYMLNPSSGSHTVDVTASADPFRDIIGYAISYENVKQSAPDDYDANNVTSGNIAVNLTAAADGSLAVFVCACGNEGTYTALTDCTIRDQQNASASESGCIGDAMNISSGDKEVGATHSNINRATIVAANWQPASGSSSYELNLEVQWTNVDYNEANEELCIYGGNMSSEDILVDLWNTTTNTWDIVFTDLTANGWKNFSITGWLTTSNFTIRFRGGNETGDATQSSWNIDATLLHVWTENYVCDYDYVLRVNNTVTDSWQVRLKKYSDSNINRLQNCTIYFHNSTDGTSNQIIIENGSYINQTGPWYDLGPSETIYIAMTVHANSAATSYVYTYLEIRTPNTTAYAQYVITFEIT